MCEMCGVVFTGTYEVYAYEGYVECAVCLYVVSEVSDWQMVVFPYCASLELLYSVTFFHYTPDTLLLPSHVQTCVCVCECENESLSLRKDHHQWFELICVGLFFFLVNMLKFSIINSVL